MGAFLLLENFGGGVEFEYESTGDPMWCFIGEQRCLFDDLISPCFFLKMMKL